MNLSRQQLIYIGLAAHLIAAFFSIGAHHADEIYQIFEFAGYKLGLNTAAELPWEFQEQMRSGFQPLLVFGFTKLCHAISINNPFTIAAYIRLIQGLFSFYISIQLLKHLEKEIKSEKYKQALWHFNILFWLLPYFHVRFSSESFGTLLFLSAFLLLQKDGQKTFLLYLGAGLLFGLAFATRFQIGFMIAGIFAWLLFIKKEKIHFLLLFVLGFGLSLGLGLLIDRWLYGDWVLSSWNYLDQNLFHNKASQFGTEPIYFFFTEGLVQLIPPFSIIIIASMLLFWWKFKTHWITWVTLPFLLLHLPVAHKEIRFLMPLLVFIPFMCVAYFDSISEQSNKVLNFIRSRGFLKFAMIFNALALFFICFKPADSSTPRLVSIYDEVQGEQALLLFDRDNPYKLGSLHYFRKPSVRTDYIPEDMNTLQKQNVYLFSEAEAPPKFKIVGTKVFYKTYCNFPDWFDYLNFNGWVERAGRYSIYKACG